MDKNIKMDLKNNFERIYSSHSDAIFRFCLIRVSDREQALDITQETFLRLWQSLQKEEEILNERAYIFTIVRRLIIDWYRKKKSLSLEKITGEDDEGVYELPDDKTTKNDLIIGSEGRYLIEKINELDPTYREPIYLRYVEDLSPPEIGKIIGISANATSVRINRGLEELRKITGYNKDYLDKLNV
jgi:RNA polymerase sigma-70 factor (ECF subfamily)